MSDQEEPTVVLCTRIEDMPVPPIRGATRDICLKCQAPVWVAPSTKTVYERALDQGEDWWGIHCLSCGLEMAGLGNEVTEEIVMASRIFEEQIEEIADNLAVVAVVPEEGQHQQDDDDDPQDVRGAAVAEDGADQQQDQK